MRILLLLGIVAYHATSFNAGIANGESTFASNFFKVVAENVSENIVCSSISADVLLSTMTFGAVGNTKNQLLSVINQNDEDSTDRSLNFLNNLDDFKEVDLRIANNIFISKDYKLNADFKFLMMFFRISPIDNIDFADAFEASNTINDWCAVNTNNLIRDLVKPEGLSEDTALVFANAIYFKGSWADKFQINETRKLPFHANGRTIEQVPTMHRSGSYRYGDLPEVNASFVELPYQVDDATFEVNMYIILPDDIDGFEQLKENLDKVTVDKLIKNAWYREVNLSLPKFKIESSINLRSPLVKLGLTDMFSDAADFSLMVDGGQLKSINIVQKVFLEVNEEGSEAAAVTGADLVNKFGDDGEEPLPVVEFNVDRPFVSIIATNSGESLFSAVIVEPRIV